jgi:hypothetical protein
MFLLLLLLGCAVLIPFNFTTIVTYSVAELQIGWVFSTIFIRFLVIIFFVLGLNLIFSYFKRTRTIKFGFVFLIGMLPGFGLSFLSPIYNTDYGDFSDQAQLDSTQKLKEYTKGGYDPGEVRHLVAFFSTSCGHCQNVSAKIGINQSGGQKISVWAFFMEPPEEIINFLGTCYGQEFDAFQISNPEFFFSVAGIELPAVYLIDKDGNTIKHWVGDVMSYTSLDYLTKIMP